MARFCGGCRRHRAAFGYETCKRERLCKRIDVSLLYLRPGLRLDQYDDLRDALELGHVRARNQFLQELVSPTPEEFPALVQAIHGVIFGLAFPEGDFAGKFRTRDEHVRVGGEGAYGFDGLRGEQIEPALVELLRSRGGFDAVPREPSAFSRWCAIFIERFFRIHPFRDGNGRTGRMLLEIAGRHAGFVFLGWHESAADRRRYVKALEYAHRHVGSSEDPERRWVNPHHGLARWIERRLIDETVLDEMYDDEFPEENRDDELPKFDFTDDER